MEEGSARIFEGLADAAIQRCQIQKARNIMDRLPKSMHTQVRRVLRQAWEMDRPKSSFAISPDVSNATGRMLPPRSWKGSTRCSP